MNAPADMRIEVESNVKDETVVLRIHFTPAALVKALRSGVLELRTSYATVATWVGGLKLPQR